MSFAIDRPLAGVEVAVATTVCPTAKTLPDEGEAMATVGGLPFAAQFTVQSPFVVSIIDV